MLALDYRYHPGGGTLPGPPGAKAMNTQPTPPIAALLSDPGLLRMQCPIGGAWHDADAGATCEVTDPATGQGLGTVPDMGAAETRRAIEAARDAFPAWAAKTA